MTIDPTDPIFHDEDKARAYFESVRWPHGPPSVRTAGRSTSFAWKASQSAARRTPALAKGH
jgi:hypothetical protein